MPTDSLPALQQLQLGHLAALAAALGWASGLRLYGVVFLVGLVGWLGWVPLPPGLAVLQQPWVLGASGLMLAIEFAADKIPFVDSAWDAVHTFVRIPGGALLAAGVFAGGGGEQGQAWPVIAGLLGGSLAATSHLAKATTRASANTSPEPFSNLGLSLLDDFGVPLMLWLAWAHPVVFTVVLAVVLVVMVAVTILLFKFLRAVMRQLKTRFGSTPQRA